MKTTRKRYSADFKAKVALEAIRGDLTLAELGAKHGIHHTMIAAWKRQAIERLVSTFSGTSGVATATERAELTRQHASRRHPPARPDSWGGTQRQIHTA